MNCCDNSGARNLYIISVKGIGARLNRLPAAGVGDMVMATVKKGKPELRKKVMPAVVVRQSKPWRRADGIFLYFEDNAGVVSLLGRIVMGIRSEILTANLQIVNPKGEMKGSAITGPVGKEAAELWPVSTIPQKSTLVTWKANILGTAYRLQLWCRHVSGCLLRETVHMGGVRAAFYAQASSMISCLKTHPLNQFFSSRNQVPPLSNISRTSTSYTTCQHAIRYPDSYNTPNLCGLTPYRCTEMLLQHRLFGTAQYCRDVQQSSF
jgi:large subunit ribosomal protein L23e